MRTTASRVRFTRWTGAPSAHRPVRGAHRELCPRRRPPVGVGHRRRFTALFLGEDLPDEVDDRVSDFFQSIRPGLRRPIAQGGHEDSPDGLQGEGVVTGSGSTPHRTVTGTTIRLAMSTSSQCIRGSALENPAASVSRPPRPGGSRTHRSPRPALSGSGTRWGSETRMAPHVWAVPLIAAASEPMLGPRACGQSPCTGGERTRRVGARVAPLSRSATCDVSPKHGAVQRGGEIDQAVGLRETHPHLPQAGRQARHRTPPQRP